MNSSGRRLMSSVSGLALWLLLSFAAGGVGAIASRSAPEFYARLVRPTWAPPTGVFGPVWTLLYLMMGIAAWLVWRERHRVAVRTAALLFIVQLAVNALWSWLFFAWHRGAWAVGGILVLLALIMMTIALFWRIRPLAGALLLPYLAWVGFATALTLSLWRRNPSLL